MAKRVIHILSGLICLLLFIGVGALAIYQIQNIAAFWNGFGGWSSSCPPGNNQPFCTTYPDRFGLVAFTVIISLIFSPAVIAFMKTMKQPLKRSKILIMYGIIVGFILVVHFSGLIALQLSGAHA